jgi:hypothetical protein
MSVVIHTYRLRESMIYCGGDEITGYLVVRGPFSRDTTVTVSLTGSCLTSHGSGDDIVEDRQIFFYMSRELYRGVLDLKKDETRTFPFKLLVPEQTEPNGQSTLKYSKKKTVFAQGPHPIPPSAALWVLTQNSWSAYVQYHLSAEVKHRFDSLWKQGAITVVSPKQALDVEIEQDAQSSQLTHASSHLVEGKATRRSVVTWLGDKLASGTPKAVFSFTARTATTLAAGAGIPIKVTLNYDPASTLPHVPEFHLLELEYRLNAITNVWCRGFFSPDFYKADQTTVFRRRIQFDQMPLTDGKTVNIGLVRNHVLQPIILDQALVSPFVSYNITRSYDVEIQIVFLCGGKKMTALCKWDKVDIMFSEDFHLRPRKQFTSDGSDALQGAAQFAKALAAGASALAAALA